MPFTTIGMALNFLTGAAIWMSGLTTTYKIFLTVVLVVKLFLFFYAVFMSEANWIRPTGLGICTALNAFIIIVGIVSKESLIAINAGITVLVLLLWTLATIAFGGSKEKEQRK